MFYNLYMEHPHLVDKENQGLVVFPVDVACIGQITHICVILSFFSTLYIICATPFSPVEFVYQINRCLLVVILLIIGIRAILINSFRKGISCLSGSDGRGRKVQN